MTTDISHDTLQRIWSAHQMGDIHQIIIPEHGVINLCRIINDTHVIRFDTLDYAFDRFQGEARAYGRLRDARGIPVPEVTALDASKSIVPYRYIILTKMPGTPISSGWHALSAAQQAQVGQAVGHALGLMHNTGFARAGRLCTLEQENMPGWDDYIFNRLHTDTDAALTLGVLDANRSKKMRAIFDRHRSLLDYPAYTRLVHGDFSMDNLLQSQGRLTAILDFEWALSGDPAWDFRLENTWERACPGCRQHIYQGYGAHQSLTPDFDCRVRLYKLLQGVNDVLFFGDEQRDDAEYQRSLGQLDAGMQLFD